MCHHKHMWPHGTICPIFFPAVISVEHFCIPTLVVKTWWLVHFQMRRSLVIIWNTSKLHQKSNKTYLYQMFLICATRGEIDCKMVLDAGYHKILFPSEWQYLKYGGFCFLFSFSVGCIGIWVGSTKHRCNLSLPLFFFLWCSILMWFLRLLMPENAHFTLAVLEHYNQLSLSTLQPHHIELNLFIIDS